MYVYIKLYNFFFPSNPDGAQILHSALQALKGGQVIAVPTDTIYGLACLAQNSDAIKRVYDIKGRNGNKPLSICVGEVQDIYKYVLCDICSCIIPCHVLVTATF